MKRFYWLIEVIGYSMGLAASMMFILGVLIAIVLLIQSLINFI